MGFFNTLKKSANNLATSLPTKSIIIKQVTSVNYDKTLNRVKALEGKVPNSQNLIAPIQLLQEASTNYNQSESENKDAEFINYIIKNIDAQQVLDTIEPIIQYIPNGNYIVMGLRFIIKMKK